MVGYIFFVIARVCKVKRVQKIEPVAASHNKEDSKSFTGEDLAQMQQESQVRECDVSSQGTPVDSFCILKVCES